MAISLSFCADLAHSVSVCRSSDSVSSRCEVMDATQCDDAVLSLRLPEDGAVCEVEAHDRHINPLYSKEDVRLVCAQVQSNARYAWQGVRNYMLLVFGICTGLRVSDLVRMRLGDIVGTDGTFRIGIDTVMKKTHGVVHINFNKVCYKAVLDWLRSVGKNPEHLCAADLDMWLANKDRAGTKAVAEDRLYRIIKRAAADAGIPYNVGSHTMRKTFSRIWYENNKSNPNAIYVLQKMLGHKSIESTLHYICVAKEESRKFAGTMEEVFVDAPVVADATAPAFTASADVAVTTNAMNTTDTTTSMDTTDVAAAVDILGTMDTVASTVITIEEPTPLPCSTKAVEASGTSLFPIGLNAKLATTTNFAVSHQTNIYYKPNSRTTKVTDFIKLTRNNTLPSFPIGFNDRKLTVTPQTMATIKLG